jgi:hypothetical protein
MAALPNPLTHALITKLIADLTPEDEWLLGPAGQAIAKLPANGFAWQRGSSIAVASANVGPLRALCTAIGADPTGTGAVLKARLKRLAERDRVWDRSAEGPPVWTTPVLSVPKKNEAEAWRTIGDFREGNLWLESWRVRYERLCHLGATGARVGDWACCIDFKSGYFVLGLGLLELLCFRAQVRARWLLDLCDGDPRKARWVLEAEGQPVPDLAAAAACEAGDTFAGNPFCEVTLCWLALVMGLKTAATVYSHLVRQVLKKWRRVDGIALINYLDDTLVTAHSFQDLEAKISIIVADCEALNLPISFEKSQLVPLRRVVFCGFLLDFTTGLVHVP